MRSMHVHTEGNGHAYIQLSPFAPPSNSFFGRMYIWVTAFPSAPDYAHFTLVEAAGSGAGVIRPIGGQYIPGKGQLWGTAPSPASTEGAAARPDHAKSVRHGSTFIGCVRVGHGVYRARRLRFQR